MEEDNITFSHGVSIPSLPNSTKLTFNGIRNDTDNVAVLYITPLEIKIVKHF